MSVQVQVRIPTSLRRFTDGNESVQLSGANVGDVLTALREGYPQLGGALFDSEGGVRRFVNVYVNEEDIRFLDQLQTELSENDEVSIIPAIAGGC